MADTSGPRFFTIEVADAKFATGADKGKRIENIGRYSSSNPLSAGRKAATRLYGEAKVNSVTFILRETTRGSGNPHFVYSAEKKKLANPVTYTRKTTLPDGSEKEDSITKTHENHVRAVRGETELRNFYKKLNIPFPADVIDDSKTSSKKTSSKPKSGSKPKSKTRGGASLADTAAPVEETGVAYEGQGNGQGGGSANSQCCQAAPADLSAAGHILSSDEQLAAHQAELQKAAQLSDEAKAAAAAERAAIEAERARILNAF